MSEPNGTRLYVGAHADAFVAVDDRVMGGVSRSAMAQTEDGTARFAGQLSLENNGGFASVRAANLSLDWEAAREVVMRVRGDGRRYKLRLHDDRRFDGVAFEAGFDTVEATWIEVRLPIEDFRPVWRGRWVRDASPLDRARIVMLGLMVSDRQQGAFALEIDWIEAR